MRLYLLPISTRQSLIYCQRINQQLTKETSYIDRITTRAAKKWRTWEKNEKGWQKKVTTYGNKLFQRLPHEEWGLKSIPPLSARPRSDELASKEKISIEFPPSLIKQDAVMESLMYFGGKDKYAYHTKWMWGSVVGMPVSAPFALIPIVPNLPFFYLVFRAWSHWRARSGSAHLQFLLEKNLVKLSPSSILDTIYAVQGVGASLKKLGADVKKEKTPSKNSSQISEESDEPETMLLEPLDGRAIADCLEVPEMEQEIERAIHQVKGALNKKKLLDEEKRALDAANEKPEAKG